MQTWCLYFSCVLVYIVDEIAIIMPTYQSVEIQREIGTIKKQQSVEIQREIGMPGFPRSDAGLLVTLLIVAPIPMINKFLFRRKKKKVHFQPS